MPYKDKAKRKEYLRQYYLKNQEKLKEKSKLYTQSHSEENRERVKLWSLNNKEKIKERLRSPHGRKKNRLNKWKSRGFVLRDGENLDDMYDIYMKTTNCKACKVLLTMYPEPRSNTTKCMDHDHETGFFRQVLCQKCNIYDKWKKFV